MKYKYLGCSTVAGCTPSPTTLLDNRSCRERNKCTRECIPKTIECPQCNKMVSTVNHLEEIETGLKIRVCNECERILELK